METYSNIEKENTLPNVTDLIKTLDQEEIKKLLNEIFLGYDATSKGKTQFFKGKDRMFDDGFQLTNNIALKGKVSYKGKEYNMYISGNLVRPNRKDSMITDSEYITFLLQQFDEGFKPPLVSLVVSEFRQTLNWITGRRIKK